MAGLIDQAQPPEEPKPTGEPTAPDTSAADQVGNQPQGAQYHSKVISAVPPAQQEAFARLVEAGRKILYSDQMAPEVQKALSENKPMWQKLGEGVARLVLLLDQQSNKTAPPELLAPAALELVADLGAGLKVSEDEIKQAQIYSVFCVSKALGVPDHELQQMATSAAQGAPQAQTEAAPAPAMQVA